METLLRDLRFSLRLLNKRPTFTALAVVCLALGIGASAAIFSVVNGVLLKPLPFPESERLIAFGSQFPGRKGVGQLSGPDFVDLRAGSTRAELAAWTADAFSFRGSATPERLRGARISSNLFRVLRATPRLGRGPIAEEELPKRDHEVVLSYGLWQRALGGDPAALGKTIHLDATEYTVVGVMAKDFSFPPGQGETDLWVPLTLAGDSTFTQSRGSHFLSGVGRLAVGVTLAQSELELGSISKRLARQFPASNSKFTAKVASLQENLVANSRLALFVLAGAVGCLLLISCANVANLMLARATLRSKEVAVRAALGASRSSIMRQLLTESVLLALIGGVAGLILAAWGTDLLLAIAPRALPRVNDVGLDWRVVMFTAVVALGTGLLFGIAPALEMSGSDLHSTLKEGGRSVTGPAKANRLRSVLVIGEVALSLILLAGAGLLSATLFRLGRVDPGFDARDVYTAHISLTETNYPSTAKQIAFFGQLLDRIRTIPGVERVGAVSILPMSGNNMMNGFALDGEPRGEGIPPQHGEQLDVVTPDYFGSMKIPVMRGRGFTTQDDTLSPPVMVVNEAFAAKYWPGQNALGKRVAPGFQNDSLRTVVGVVGDVRRNALNEDPAPAMYLAHAQNGFSQLALTVKGRAKTIGLAAALRREVGAMDPDQSLGQVKPLSSVLTESLSRQRFSASLLGLFAFIALALSAVGIFGVMTAMVTHRTRELAVRIALGADPRKVLQLILSHGATLTAVGIIVGLAGAFALSRLVVGLLYGVGASDPATLAEVSVLLAAVALLACYIPARRATHVDPIVTLRDE